MFKLELSDLVNGGEVASVWAVEVDIHFQIWEVKTHEYCPQEAKVFLATMRTTRPHKMASKDKVLHYIEKQHILEIFERFKS